MKQREQGGKLRGIEEAVQHGMRFLSLYTSHTVGLKIHHYTSNLYFIAGIPPLHANSTLSCDNQKYHHTTNSCMDGLEQLS